MKELREQFDGRGEVRGFKFTQLEKTDTGYLYEVRHSDTSKPHYEVFKRKENTHFGNISYPTSKAFGRWAWSCSNIEAAKAKLESFKPFCDKCNDTHQIDVEGGLTQCNDCR